MLEHVVVTRDVLEVPLSCFLGRQHIIKEEDIPEDEARDALVVCPVVQLYKICLPQKLILRQYFQENRNSRRCFLVLRISFPGIGPCAYPLPRPPTSWPSYFSSLAWLPESSRQALHNIPFQDYWFDPHTTYGSFINKACVTQNENGRATSSQPSSNYISGSAVCYKHEEVAIKSIVPFHFRATKIPFLKSFSRAVCLVCGLILKILYVMLSKNWQLELKLLYNVWKLF